MIKIKPASRPKPYESVLSHLFYNMNTNTKEMANWTDMTISMLSRIVARTKPCPLKHAFRLASFFECEIKDLFGKDGLALRFDQSKFYKGGAA